MAKAKKARTKSKKPKASQKKKKAPESFQTFWTQAGNVLQKELKKEKGLDAKTIRSRISGDPQFQAKVLEAVKRLFPAAPVAAVAASTGSTSSIYQKETVPPSRPSSTPVPSPSLKGLSPFNKEAEDFWHGCEKGEGEGITEPCN